MTEGPPQALGQRLRSAQRILIVHLGALGDTLHQIAAIHAIRVANPKAEIHCLVGAGQLRLMALFPWIDQVWTAPPRLGFAHWGKAWRLRHALQQLKFDLAIAFWPRNTIAAWLWFSGARWRVCRRPQASKPAALVPWISDEILEYPWFEQPWYLENCKALARVGLAEADASPVFEAQVDMELRRALGISAADDHRYLHFSPFSTADRRDPPLADLAALLNALNAAISPRPIVISSAGDTRQRERLAALLALLDFQPWKVFAGSLSADQFASVVAGCALHLGPDSGGIHMAMVLERPILTWFRESSEREQRNLRHFAPPAERSTVFVSRNPAEDALHDLPLLDMAQAAVRMLG